MHLRSIAAVCATLVAACGGAGPSPDPAPRPAGRPTATGRDSTAQPLVPTPGSGASASFGYSSGTQRYAVVSTAEVQLAGDTGGVAMDSLVTRSYLTVVLGGGGAGQSVGGAIDSVFVTSRRSPTASQGITTGVPFSGTLTPSGVRFASDTVPPPRCGPASTDALLAVARDLIVALPPALVEGATWRDSTSTVTCRGNVPTTVSTVSDYRVTRVSDEAGARAATVERTSRSAIVGQGASGGASTTLNGTSTAQGRFTFDATAGRYTGGEVTSAAEIAVNVNGRPQRLTQRGTTRISLVAPTP
jgi:hypothetical protein